MGHITKKEDFYSVYKSEIKVAIFESRLFSSQNLSYLKKLLKYSDWLKKAVLQKV